MELNFQFLWVKIKIMFLILTILVFLIIYIIGILFGSIAELKLVELNIFKWDPDIRGMYISFLTVIALAGVFSIMKGQKKRY